MSDLLPFVRLSYSEPNATTNAIGYAQFYNRSCDAAENVIEVHKYTGATLTLVSFSRFTSALPGTNDLLWRKSPFRSPH